MNARPKIDMIEATRLTRAGRLDEAMAVLRGALPTELSSGAAGQPAGGAPRNLDQPGAVSEPRIPQALRGFLDRIRQHRFARGLSGLVRGAAGAAPAALPNGARFDQRIHAGATGSRAYKLYVPGTYDGQALPLVVMMHGCTQSPDDFAAGTRMNALAEAQNFLVAYPAQSQSANTSKCWNWFNTADQRRDQGEPALIAGITREVMRDFPVAPGRVYIAGLSAGGAAAAVMGATYPDLYAAIGVHSGLPCGAASDVPSAFAAMRQGGASLGPRSRRHGGEGGAVPTIVFHGDSDTTVHPVNGDQVIAQAKAAAALRATTSRGAAPGGINYTRIVQADESGRPILEQWVLHGAGHAWSGGSAEGSYTEPRGPDASREMLRFFLQHPAAPAT